MATASLGEEEHEWKFTVTLECPTSSRADGRISPAETEFQICSFFITRLIFLVVKNLNKCIHSTFNSHINVILFTEFSDLGLNIYIYLYFLAAFKLFLVVFGPLSWACVTAEEETEIIDECWSYFYT